MAHKRRQYYATGGQVILTPAEAKIVNKRMSKAWYDSKHVCFKKNIKDERTGRGTYGKDYPLRQFVRIN